MFRAQRRIIGWKLCYVHGDKLIDKYVGFAYPEARRYGLFFVSWAECIDYALRHGLKHYISGRTDAEIKAYLGAQFTLPRRHAVYLRNPLLRFGLHASDTSLKATVAGRMPTRPIHPSDPVPVTRHACLLRGKPSVACTYTRFSPLR